MSKLHLRIPVRWPILALLAAALATAVAVPLIGPGRVAEAVTVDGISPVSGEAGEQFTPAVVDLALSQQVYVAYASRDGDQATAIYGRKSFDNGSNWQDEQLVTTGQDDSDFPGFHSRGVFRPDLARETGGDLWLVYSQFFGSDDNPEDTGFSLVHFETGTSAAGDWSGADGDSVASAGAPGHNFNPAVVRASQDRIIVAWLNQDVDDNRSLLYRYTDDFGVNWEPSAGHLRLDDTPGISNVRHVDLAADNGNGVAAAFWACRDSDGVCGTFVRKSDDNGATWSLPALVAENGTQPSIAAEDFSWKLTYTLRECPDLPFLGYCQYNIYERPSGEGVFWGSPIKLTTFEGEDRNSSVAVGIQFDRFVAWQSDRRANSDFVSQPTIWFTSNLAPIDSNPPPAVPRLENLPAPSPMVGDDVRIMARVAMLMPAPPATPTAPVLMWTMNGVDMPDVEMESAGEGIWRAGIGPFERAGDEIGYRVMVEDVNGSMTSHERGFAVQPRFNKTSNVLLVIDDHNEDRAEGRTGFYWSALASAGVRHDVWDASRLGPPRPEVLHWYTHGAVVWSAAHDDSWLWDHPIDADPARAALGSYLDHGGSLVISGQQIAETLADRDPDWLMTYLRVSFGAGSPVNRVLGEGAIEGIEAALEGDESANNSYSLDEILPAPGAGPIFRYGTSAAPSDTIADVWQRMGQRRVAFLAFNFEAIDGADIRNEVMRRLIHWANPTCNGWASTIDGTGGPDTLIGTDERDVIIGYGSKDRIWGRGGDDVICGMGGDDVVSAGDGNDWVGGGNGSDRISGGQGSDAINGGRGADLVLGGDGADVISGDRGNDQIAGGGGDDYISGGPGADHLLGDDGDDIIEGGRGADWIDCGDGSDIGDGGPGNDASADSCELQASIP